MAASSSGTANCASLCRHPSPRVQPRGSLSAWHCTPSSRASCAQRTKRKHLSTVGHAIVVHSWTNQWLELLTAYHQPWQSCAIMRYGARWACCTTLQTSFANLSLLAEDVWGDMSSVSRTLSNFCQHNSLLLDRPFNLFFSRALRAYSKFLLGIVLAISVSCMIKFFDFISWKKKDASKLVFLINLFFIIFFTLHENAIID